MKPNWFVGIEVPAGSWYAPVAASAPPEVRTFHPADLHLTVAFFGPCDEARARGGWEAARRIPFAPFPVRLGGLAPMGDRRRPSALSVLLSSGAEPVAAYMAQVQTAALEAAGCRPERRAPKPHVTVARPRRNAPDAERRRAVEWATALPPIDVDLELTRLCLFTWAAERAGGRRFRAVETLEAVPQK
jgi:2'-5' RNA ligase